MKNNQSGVAEVVSLLVMAVVFILTVAAVHSHYAKQSCHNKAIADSLETYTPYNYPNMVERTGYQQVYQDNYIEENCH